MLQVCASRNKLRTITQEKQRKQKDLDTVQERFDRIVCSRPKSTSSAKQACQILNGRITRLKTEVSKLEQQRVSARTAFWDLVNRYKQACGALPSKFSSAKTVTIRKQGTQGLPCRWRQPC
jgi:hypothetical protein